MERPFGPRAIETEAPRRSASEEDEKPIPREWILGGLALAVLVAAAVLYGSQRAWRSSNLFDRQYRFPVQREVALRFGGQKSGGHMAVVQFKRPRETSAPAGSKTKDA